MFDKFAPDVQADIERFFSFFIANHLTDAERERLYLYLQAWFVRRRNPRISA